MHHDRHGHEVEERKFSVPVTSDEGDSDAFAMSQSGVTAIGNSYIPAGCIEGREEEDEIELGDFLCSGIEFVPIRRKGGADGC